jgi:hypothetical protein
MLRNKNKHKIRLLKDRYVQLMSKWWTYKRNGSAPHSPEYIADRKIMRAIAAELDRLDPRGLFVGDL